MVTAPVAELTFLVLARSFAGGTTECRENFLGVAEPACMGVKVDEDGSSR